MNVYAAVLFFAFAVAPIFGQQDQTFNGTCPVVTTQVNFNETKYTGRWYEIKKYPNTLVTGDCRNDNYVLAQNNANFSVNVISRNLATNLNSSLNLVLKKQVINPTPGKYDVYVYGTKDRIPDYILETDYTTYSIEWGCTYSSASRNNTQRLSVYSRQKTLSAAVYNNVVNTLRKFKIDDSKLKDVVQDDKRCGR